MNLAKYAPDSTLFTFDCTKLMAADETIAQQPVMSYLPAFDVGDAGRLLFGAPLVNSIPIPLPDGTVMGIGKGFQVRISGGASETNTAKRIYAVSGTFLSSAGNTLTTKAPLWLLPPGYSA